MDVVVVSVTCPTQTVAVELARTLVTEHLAACGSVVPGLRSIYSWQGQIHDDTEFLLLLKTRASVLDDLSSRVVALHPYDLPEIIATPVQGGLRPYLDWVIEQVHQPDAKLS